MFARTVMAVVNEFVVCVVAVAQIIAWNVPSKFILNFFGEGVLARRPMFMGLFNKKNYFLFSSNQRGQVPKRERDTRLDIEYVTYVQCPKKCNNGRVRCTTCSAQGMVTCETCEGSGQLVHYLELTRTFTDIRLKISYRLYII